MKHPRALPAFAAACTLVACSGGGSNPLGTVSTSGDFIVLRTTPRNNERLALNESLAIDFSNPVELESADLNTVSFQVFDLNGTPLLEQPAGTFTVEDTPGDPVAGRRLVFAPRFPTSDTFDDGGFRPGRRYLVQLAAGSDVTTLHDASPSRKPLRAPASFTFTTAIGTTPAELFKDTKPGGPRRSGFTLNQTASTVLGNAAAEVRLELDQPLNPATLNVPRIAADPIARAGQDRGRISLAYDDGNATDLWIPATVHLERNALEGATVVLRPIGVLPTNATIRVVVTSTLEDIAGESNVADTAYNPVFATFRTPESFAPQYEAIFERFDAAANSVDFDAPLLEPFATIDGGALTSTFAFDGRESTLDYEPNAVETILDTNFTQIAPIGAEPINVSGGVFRFRSVSIPAGRTVRGVGPNPMVWTVTGDFRVDGRLSVDGGDGARVDSLNFAQIPVAGGIGVCGGGNGGRGTPSTTMRDARGEAGFGPGQRPAGGGGGGNYYCASATGACTGSGGGGGSFATQGDPEFRGTQLTAWSQWRGSGGATCGVVPGASGPRPFVDSRADNDFFGAAVNVHGKVRVRGELVVPIGGAGGGGGGDKAARCQLDDPTFINDMKGGGGGGGGGVLVIQALGKIIIGPQGRISADGGAGGGGEQAGANNQGGGGGGGSGGMVILMAAGGVEIARHGNAYADTPADTAFAISADGGIGEQGDFSNLPVPDKYVGFNEANVIGRATGGFGGMGVVQIFAPAGDDADDTGCFLDDRIRFLQNGSDVSRADKKKLLAWRGWRDASGDRRDDDGELIAVTRDGDIRPAPILLPLPYGPKSRAQSRWIDLGAAARREGTSGVGAVAASPPPQPDYEFAGVRTADPDAGYVAWNSVTGARTVPVVVPAAPFSEFEAHGVFAGLPAYRIRVASPQLAGAPENRYAHYRAELLDEAGNVQAAFRVLGHGRVAISADSYVYLDPTAAFPTGASRVRIVAQMFAVTTDGAEGLGTYAGTKPRANVRIGFAFHVDPASEDPMLRYPATGFSADVAGLLMQMNAAGHRPTFVKWDVVFDQRFGDASPLTPEMPVQKLDDLALPFRY